MNNNLWTNYADGIFVRDKASPFWGEYELDEKGKKIPMYLTDDDAEFYTSVTGLSQSAVMYTEDIKKLMPERQWLLSLILPIYQDGKFRPVNLFKTKNPKTLQLMCQGKMACRLISRLNWILKNLLIWNSDKSIIQYYFSPAGLPKVASIPPSTYNI